MAATPKAFFEALWSGVKGGHALLKLVRAGADGKAEAKDATFPWPSGVDALLARASSEPGWQAYYGVGIRSAPTAGRLRVFAVPALWATLNLGGVPLDRAVQALKSFPLRASAGVLAGETLTAYWFLKEPLEAKDSRLLLAVHQRMAECLGEGKPEANCVDPFLDRIDLKSPDCAYDIDDVLRVPGSTDDAVGRPKKVDIVAWRPELRHDIADMCALFVKDAPDGGDGKSGFLAAAKASVEGAAEKETREARPAQAPAKAPDKAAPGVGEDIPSDLGQKIAKLMVDLWIDGYQEKVAQHFSGALALAGFSQASVLDLFGAVCALTHDAARDARLAAARRSFERHLAGEPITGWTSISKWIDGELSGAVQEKAKKAYGTIRKVVQGSGAGGKGGSGGGDRRGKDPDFEILEMVRFTSDPAIYRVRLKLAAEKLGKTELEIRVEEDDAYNFSSFRERTFGQAHIYLAAIGQGKWEEMVEAAPFRVEEAPPEARVAGAIGSALEDFVENKKEDPEIGDLKSFPGYNEREVFFRLTTFKAHLKDDAVKFTDRQMLDELKRLGWRRETKRFGPVTAKVWTKAVDGNGHAEATLFDVVNGVEEGGL